MTTLLSPGDITFCEGSLLLQTTPSTDIGTILLQRPNGTLLCQHCYLVVADADDIKSIAPDQDWSMLVSCHVQACGSLHDRRAAYCCYACLERGKMNVEGSMAKLREHLEGCELVKLGEMERKRRDGWRGGSGSGKTGARKGKGELQSVEATSTKSTRNSTANPYRQAPEPQMAQANASPVEAQPPLPSRPRAGAPTTAEKMYTPANTRRAAEQQQQQQASQAGPSRPNPFDIFNIPGGFPGQANAAGDSRTSSLLDYSPSVPRRKDVVAANHNPNQNANQNSSFPAQPSRAPPAPPVLSPPSIPAYYQGNESTNQQQSAHDPRTANAFSNAEAAKIQQLVGLGIPRVDAEYLLNRTGGDVNAAAELQLAEMGSMGGPAVVPLRDGYPQHGGGLPSPLGSNPPGNERRNRRSK